MDKEKAMRNKHNVNQKIIDRTVYRPKGSLNNCRREIIENSRTAPTIAGRTIFLKN